MKYKYKLENLEKYGDYTLNRLGKERNKLIYPDCGCVGKIPIMMLKNHTRIKQLELQMDEIINKIEKPAV